MVKGGLGQLRGKFGWLRQWLGWWELDRGYCGPASQLPLLFAFFFAHIIGREVNFLE